MNMKLVFKCLSLKIIKRGLTFLLQIQNKLYWHECKIFAGIYLPLVSCFLFSMILSNKGLKGASKNNNKNMKRVVLLTQPLTSCHQFPLIKHLNITPVEHDPALNNKRLLRMDLSCLNIQQKTSPGLYFDTEVMRSLWTFIPGGQRDPDICTFYFNCNITHEKKWYSLFIYK